MNSNNIKDIDSIKKLVFQYFSGSLPLDKEKELNSFINANAENTTLFREWEKEWIDAAQHDSDIDAEWEDFISKKSPFAKPIKPVRHITFSLWKQVASTAAILVIAVLSTLYVQNLLDGKSEQHYVTVEAPYGEKSKITLADGSLVWLNSGSKLTYADKNKKNKQIVKLIGEGYFEIEKNSKRKFIVSTNSYDIQVVGTKFNVTAYPEDRYVTTTLMEGKVNLLTTHVKAELKPGESIAFDTTIGQLKKPDLALQDANAWIHNAIIYDNITLKELTAKLSRQFDVSIQIQSDNLANKKFNIALRNDETISEVMFAIEKILNVNVRNVGINYYIGDK